MVLRYRGLTPADTVAVEPAELARRPDPANAAMVAFQKARGVAQPVQESAPLAQNIAGKVRVPDMTGWPLRLVIQKATELGVKPRIEGSGLLARQVPLPGQIVDAGSEVVLVFEPAT
jgi:hypothetical protein